MRESAALRHESVSAPCPLPSKAFAAPLRLAIIGGGAVTSEYYLPAIARLPGVTVETILDPSPRAKEHLRGAGYEGPIESRPFEEFFADPRNLESLGIDGVVVALPNFLHERATLSALKAGLPVLCEKPLALTEAACRRMDEAARQLGKILAVGMVRRKTASAIALKEALAADLIGPIESISIEDGSPFQWLSDSGAFFDPQSGGVLADMGVHFLDLARHLFGPLEPIRYQDDWRGGCEANVEFHLRTREGAALRLALSRDRSLSNQIMVSGRKGKLCLEKDNFETCTWLPGGSGFQGVLRATRPFDRDWAPEFISAFTQQLQEFRELVNGGKNRCVSAEEATDTIRLIEWAYRDRMRISHIESRKTRRTGVAGKVFVTGGTGFIGSRLVAHLTGQSNEKLELRAPVRSYRSCVELGRFPVEMPKLDLLDARAVAEAVKGHRFIFHLAYGRDGDGADRITTEGTRNVVEGARLAGAEVVVVISTMSVFGHPESDTPVDETWPYAPESDYGKTKKEMEKWCLEQAAREDSPRIVLLNPSCVYGPGGKTYTRLPAELAKDGCFAWVENGRGIANYTYIDNLIDAILAAALEKSAHGKRFLINDGACSWREFLTPLLGRFAPEIPSFTIEDLIQLAKNEQKGPADLLKAVLGSPEVRRVVAQMPVLGTAKSWLSRRAPNLRQVGREASMAPEVNPPVWLRDLFGPTTTRFSAEAAKHALNWSPKVGLEEGHRLSVQWLKEMRVL